jgi:hemolysin activation/secretion protein
MIRSTKYIRLLYVIITSIYPGYLLAQSQGIPITPVLPQELDLSRQRVPQAPLSKPEADLIRPPLVNQEPIRSDADDQFSFLLKNVEITGSTVFKLEDLKAIFEPLLGREITLKQLRDSVSIIETRYNESGFFLSRALIPPQILENDVARIQVIEGFISTIKVDGLDSTRQDFVNQAMSQVLDQRPLKFATLESAMLLLNDTPGLQATSVLNPGTIENSSELTILLSEAPPNQSISIRNGNSTVSGPWSLSYSGIFSQIAAPLLSRPHSLQLSLNGAGGQLEKSRSVSARLTTGIGESGMQWSIGALLGDAKPGGAAQALNLTSESHSINTRLRLPLLRSRNNTIYADAGLSSNVIRSQISNLILSDDQTTVAELGLYSIINTQNSDFISIGLNWLRGLSILGAMDERAPAPSVIEFDPEFNKLTLNYLHLHALNEKWAISLNATAQHTQDKLVNGEVIAFGGSQIGRGFFPGSLVGDRGRGGLVEVRYTPGSGKIQWFAFADHAQATLLATGASSKQVDGRLSSAGAGLRFNLANFTQIEFQLAHGISSQGINLKQSQNKFLIALSWSF